MKKSISTVSSSARALCGTSGGMIRTSPAESSWRLPATSKTIPPESTYVVCSFGCRCSAITAPFLNSNEANDERPPWIARRLTSGPNVSAGMAGTLARCTAEAAARASSAGPGALTVQDDRARDSAASVNRRTMNSLLSRCSMRS
ncbi:hypothetical protein WME81_24640 [Sorangium sp. So ce1078]